MMVHGKVILHTDLHLILRFQQYVPLDAEENKEPPCI